MMIPDSLNRLSDAPASFAEPLVRSEAIFDHNLPYYDRGFWHIRNKGRNSSMPVHGWHELNGLIARFHFTTWLNIQDGGFLVDSMVLLPKDYDQLPLGYKFYTLVKAWWYSSSGMNPGTAQQKAECSGNVHYLKQNAEYY